MDTYEKAEIPKGPIKQSAFVLLFSYIGDDVPRGNSAGFVARVTPSLQKVLRMYTLRHVSGAYGAPGGKREKTDADLWETASREFKEETGGTLPPQPSPSQGAAIKGKPDGRYRHIEWGDDYHIIKVFYRVLTAEEAQLLPIGPLDDPDCDELEALWHDPRRKDKRFRYHIEKAIAMCSILGELPPRTEPHTKASRRPGNSQQK